MPSRNLTHSQYEMPLKAFIYLSTFYSLLSLNLFHLLQISNLMFCLEMLFA
nr:MAG TPA: hypothetical protein [Caudoviricetes sp.]